MIKDLIIVKKEYVNKLGENKFDTQFYVVLDNDRRVRISPYFCDIKGKEWNTFNDLLLIAKVIDNEK